MKNIRDILNNQQLIQATLTKPLSKENFPEKIVIKPIIIKGQESFQFTSHKGTKVFHENIIDSKLLDTLIEAVKNFGYSFIRTKEFELHAHQKNGTFSIKRKMNKLDEVVLEHNRTKNYILPEGIPNAYLIELGLMSPNGKILAAKAHKFKQINRFLELVDHSLNDISSIKPFHMVDLGCGKAYLTFALYHYLREIRGIPVMLTGIDRRKDVIDTCIELAQKLKYENLHFYQQDIDSFHPERPLDAVVSLHACDVATDYALAKAIEWQANFIFAAPCCQHELFEQVANKNLESLLRHGILKERFAAMITDAARTELLATCGYKAQIIEFIDLEHSPKNLMIRAEKTDSRGNAQAKARFMELKKALNIEPKLESLLAKSFKL